MLIISWNVAGARGVSDASLAAVAALLGACTPGSHSPDASTEAGVPLECVIADSVIACETSACELACDGQPCVLHGDPGQGAVCMTSDDTTCSRFRSCDVGNVCVSYTRETFADPFSNAWFCVEPEGCIAGRAALDLPASAACLYGDLTPAVSGELPMVSCDDRPSPWNCGHGCDCGGTRCLLASEAHPWGLCARESRGFCPAAASECGAGSSCLRVAVSDELRARYLGAIEPDICLASAVCESMAALYPDAYSCDPSGL